MGKLRARCNVCDLDLWAKRQGEMTLKTKILKQDTDGNFSAKCPKCGNDVPIPFLRVVDPDAPAILVVSLDGAPIP